MTGYRKVFLDTAPIIYFLEILGNGKGLATSVITCMEYLTFPYRNNNYEKAEAFFEFVSDCDIPLYSVNMEIAKKASMIRAE